MTLDKLAMNRDEQAALGLRALYEAYGYAQYKMNKFEEYDLYLRNKDFLVSDHIITFTDIDGKLMALKPDVTLSIVKNGSDDDPFKKVYYNENVYRVARGGNAFREIMQVGLECVGDIDAYRISEVLSLAAKSLAYLSDDYVLDVSHMGVISEVIDSLSPTKEERNRLLNAVSEKNTHDIADIAGSERVARLISCHGSTESVRATLTELYPDGLSDAAAALLTLVGELEENGYAGHVRIDFSVESSCRYYNGIVFRGFINGIPTGILSGGQYDLLMKKLHRTARAIGFAVYLDLLEYLPVERQAYDVDTVVLYTAVTPVAAVRRMVEKCIAEGVSVNALREIPAGIRCRRIIRMNEKGDVTCETNA